MNPGAAVGLVIGAIFLIFAIGRIWQLRQRGGVEVNSAASFSAIVPLGVGIGVIVASLLSWYYTTR